MEQNSLEDDSLKSLVKNLHKQESERPHRDLRGIVPLMYRENVNFQFLKALITPSN